MSSTKRKVNKKQQKQQQKNKASSATNFALTELKQMMSDASTGSKELIDLSGNSISTIKNKVGGMATKGLEGIQNKVNQVKGTIQRTMHNQQEPSNGEHQSTTPASNPMKAFLLKASEKLPSNKSLTVDSLPTKQIEKVSPDTKTTTTATTSVGNSQSKPRKNLARSILAKAEEMAAMGKELAPDGLDDENKPPRISNAPTVSPPSPLDASTVAAKIGNNHPDSDLVKKSPRNGIYFSS